VQQGKNIINTLRDSCYHHIWKVGTASKGREYFSARSDRGALKENSLSSMSHDAVQDVRQSMTIPVL
jgi:hypothetical protein